MEPSQFDPFDRWLLFIECNTDYELIISQEGAAAIQFPYR
jgi:hypothetical protein